MAATYGRLTGTRRRLPDHARSRRAQSDDRRRLCASRRDADGDDHRAEGDPEQPAGAIPDRRHRRDHAAADQDGDADRRRRRAFRPWCATPSGSRSRSGRARFISNCPRTSRPTRPRPTSFRRIRSSCRSRLRRRIDRAAAHDHRRPSGRWSCWAPRRAARGSPSRCRRSCADCGIPFFNTQMGKGAVNAGSNLYMGTAALSERD